MQEKSLSGSMNLKHGEVDGAHIMRNVHLGLCPHETLALICAEQNVNAKNYSDSDWDSCVTILDDFCKSSNEYTGYTVSVWFDDLVDGEEEVQQ